MSPKAQTLADRIRHCATLVGSGNELARRSGVARRTLETYLNGREPQASRLAAIAKAAGVSLDWLVTGEEANRPPVDGAVVEGPPPHALPSTLSFDEGFSGQVGETVEHLFRQEGMRPSARELVQVSTRILAEVYSATSDPIERLGVLKTLLDQERAALRDAAARKPGSRKSTV